MTRNGFAACGLMLLAGCVAPRQAPAPVPPPPAPAPPPSPPPQPVPADDDWHYAPLSPGTWTYQSEGDGAFSARFGLPGARALVILRCVRTPRQMILAWPASGGDNRVTVTTSYSVRSFSGAAPAMVPEGFTGVSIGATDSVLDQMAFSRGRIMIASGMPARAAILPAWPEITRVIEDCRK